jgi:lysozyme family protein
MIENFGRILEHVLAFEGGYSDHPSDPGGATKYGITRATLTTWRRREVTKAEVKSLTVEEAGEIYRAKYWDRIKGDLLPAGVDLAVMDCCVNQGEGRAVRLLQMALGVAVDGKLGPKTLAAVEAADPLALILEFQARRMNAYGLLVGLFRTFGLGWSRRLTATVRAALELANDQRRDA